MKITEIQQKLHTGIEHLDSGDEHVTTVREAIEPLGSLSDVLKIVRSTKTFFSGMIEIHPDIVTNLADAKEQYDDAGRAIYEATADSNSRHASDARAHVRHVAGTISKCAGAASGNIPDLDILEWHLAEVELLVGRITERTTVVRENIEAQPAQHQQTVEATQTYLDQINSI
jgi:hypothetical protein